MVIDEFYAFSREELFSYEDARLGSLLANVADCLYPLNDTTIWGSLLRSIAIELAQIEVQYSAAVVNVDQQYLTPPNIRRQLAGPLSISKVYPQADQYDRSYRAMVVALMAAYHEGLTTKAMEDVLLAYTGKTVVVEELYKLIGNGVYDASDRNTVQVTVDLSTSFSTMASVDELQTVSQALKAALQLALPAHVGLNYLVSVGDAEDVSPLLMGITDIYQPEYDATETYPLEPVLTAAPLLNSSSPITEVSAAGRRVGSVLPIQISHAAYLALPYDSYRAEYQIDSSGDGMYMFTPNAANDTLLLDANGNPTGVISKAVGILGPVEELVWQIQSDELDIYSLD